MEYLPDTLWDAMKAGSLDDPAKVSVVMQLLSALDYLSRRDPYVVHRDIKPKNIFLKAGTCVLGDFGLGVSGRDSRRGGPTRRGHSGDGADVPNAGTGRVSRQREEAAARE